MKKRILIVLALIAFNAICSAQCEFTPTVTGDLLLCPDSDGVITTEEYESYQWFRRSYSGEELILIEGATNQTFDVNAYEDGLSYFAVSVTLDGCEELSEEVLLDGWAFASIVTITTGEFTFGTNGDLLVCEGESLELEVGLPYNTNVIWYNNWVEIEGENETTLIVDEDGSYTVSGAPGICPNYVQTQAIPVNVEMIDCGTGVNENELNSITVRYDSGAQHLLIENAQVLIRTIDVFDLSGKLIVSKTGNADPISLNDSGIYVVKIYTDKGVKTSKINVQ